MLHIIKIFCILNSDISRKSSIMKKQEIIEAFFLKENVDYVFEYVDDSGKPVRCERVLPLRGYILCYIGEAIYVCPSPDPKIVPISEKAEGLFEHFES